MANITRNSEGRFSQPVQSQGKLTALLMRMFWHWNGLRARREARALTTNVLNTSPDVPVPGRRTRSHNSRIVPMIVGPTRN
jgi:hypothetical protein